MRMTHYSAIGFSIVFASCTALDPDYAEYKKLKDAQAAGQSPYGQVGDFGVPGAGPEGAPFPASTMHLLHLHPFLLCPGLPLHRSPSFRVFLPARETPFPIPSRRVIPSGGSPSVMAQPSRQFRPPTESPEPIFRQDEHSRSRATIDSRFRHQTPSRWNCLYNRLPAPVRDCSGRS